jgi:hypothetical protein
VLFQLTGDRCEQLDEFEVGDDVSVEFSLRGREWKSPRGEIKFFNSLDVWTITKSGQAGGSDPFGGEQPPLPDGPPPDDDPPF